MHVAVIGIGSNSVRLLVADCAEGAMRTVHRGRCGTRLFAGLQAGALSADSMAHSCQAVAEMAACARQLGAQTIHAFATSAVRDASNREVFCAMVRNQAGLTLEICSGEEEALLSFLGAARPGRCGMIDIGGGSTEWVVGQDGTPLAAVSMQMGGVRLHRRVPIHSAADIPRAQAEAHAVLQTGTHAFDAHAAPAQWVGVGGTFTTLAAMDKGLASFDRSLVEGYLLTEARVAHWAHALADMTMAERCHVPGLQPQRADIVVHGIAILMACMQLWGMPAITVSDHGNLDGYLRRKLRTATA